MAPLRLVREITVDGALSAPRPAFTLKVYDEGGRLDLYCEHGYRGPDILVPTRPEVERWLSEACAEWLEGIWYCTFRFRDEAAYHAFLAAVGVEAEDPA